MNSLLNKTFFLIIFLSSQFIKSYEFNIRQVGDTFDDPWSLAFIDEDKFLLSEMPGNLKVISLDTGELIYSVKGVPQVLYDGQGGLSDVVLDPKFSENKKIYFSYSAEDTEEGQLVDDLFSPSNTLFVASASLVGDTLKDLKIIFKAKVCDGFGVSWCEESSFGARAEAAEVLNVVELEFVCVDAADARA